MGLTGWGECWVCEVCGEDGEEALDGCLFCWGVLAGGRRERESKGVKVEGHYVHRALAARWLVERPLLLENAV